MAQAQKQTKKEHKRWMKLDNAAKIYPAARSRGWMALFRVSAELSEPVVPEVLSAALARVMPRFPAFAVRLKSGLFWNYLEHLEGAPTVQQDVQNPCVTMDFRRTGGFMLRVRYYNCRIAVEFFHVLTDGTGGLVFLKTLVAEYLSLRYNTVIPRDSEILDCDETPPKEELVDGFLQYAREMSRSRKEDAAWRIPGTRTWHFMHVTTGIIPAYEVLQLAKSYDATVTEFLTAVMIDAVLQVQKGLVPVMKKRKPVKICVPVNLRRYYGSVTIRNFASYANPGVEPCYGEYTLPEIMKIVKGYMAVELDEKLMNAKFSTNVHTERKLVLRLAPWFIKRQAMKLAFRFKGDRYSSSSLSNLGVVRLPGEMEKYVERMDFMLGPLYRNRVTAAMLTYKGMLYIDFTRTIEEAEVERHFFTSLVKMGVPVQIESNENL